jgi:hypothetical protein
VFFLAMAQAFVDVKNSSGIGTNLIVEVAVATNFSC